MLYGIRTVFSYLLGIDIAGRNFAVYPDDTLLVSYPRSGNTWTRFLIANLLFPQVSVDFTNIERLIPDTTLQSSRTIKQTPRPRIIKTHEYFDHRYPKTIYIVRDPREVALSYYNYCRRNSYIADDTVLEKFIDRFVAGKLEPCWGTWGEHVSSWVYSRGATKSFLLLHYEDMRMNPGATLRRIAQFMGIDPDPAHLHDAVEKSSLERMHVLEELQYEQWLNTQGYVARRAKQKRVRHQIPFIGAATADGWRKMPESCVCLIESGWGPLMTSLGYELVTRPKRRTALRIRAQSSPLTVVHRGVAIASRAVLDSSEGA